MARNFLSLLAVGLLAAGCKTITEDLPTAPSTTGGTPFLTIPIPIRVVPVTLPEPQSPAPTPTPAKNPTPSATPAPEDGNGEDIPNNTTAVARVLAKVYFVECNGAQVSGSEFATTAEVGCRVHLDATAKDSGGKPTQARSTPQWSYSDTSSISLGGRSPYNPVFTVNKQGSTSISCTIDGVRSNEFSIRFK